MGRHDVFGPGCLPLSVRVRQREHQHRSPARGERGEARGVVARRNRPAVPRRALVAFGTEVFVEQVAGDPALGVVVARQHAVRYARVIEHALHARCDLEFVAGTILWLIGIDPVLNEISGVRGERDLALLGAAHDPAHDVGVHLRIGLGEVLRIGQVADREVVVGRLRKLLVRRQSLA